MKIGIISDTHDNATNLVKAVKIFNRKKVSLVIHCGDWVSPSMPYFCQDLKCKIMSLFGNNSGDIYRFMDRKIIRKWNIDFFSEALETEIDGKKIAAYHGSSEIILNALLKSQIYDVVMSGHNHVAKIDKNGKTLHINPGTTGDSVNRKIINKPSIGIYDTKTDKAEIINI